MFKKVLKEKYLQEVAENREATEDVITIQSSEGSEDEDDIKPPTVHRCHRCPKIFITRALLLKHLELHDKGYIYIAGQSVVPDTWLGRQVPTIKAERKEPAQIKGKKRKNKHSTTTTSMPQSTTFQWEEIINMGEDSASSSYSTPTSSPLKKKERRSFENTSIPFKERAETPVTNTNIDYYDNDCRLPVFMREPKGIKTTDAVSFISSEKFMDNRYISKVVPTNIKENVTCLVSSKSVGNWKNLLSDDLGAWNTTCSATRYVNYNSKGDLNLIPAKEPDCFTVKRNQYINKSSPDLHRIIVRVSSHEEWYDTVLVQYYFDDEEHSVLVKPHGNRRHESIPYRRTQETVKQTMKDMDQFKPKDVFHKIIENAGGLENLTSGSQKPRDRQQIYNLRKQPYGDEILEAVDIKKNEDLKFIREIELSPEFAIFLATETQLKEMEKFCTNSSNFCIVGVDTTFNIGSFYVTLTTYRNLMLEHKKLLHEPVMLGPALIHQKRSYDSFFLLPSNMIREKPGLGNIIVFGTDGEVNLTKAFESCMPFAKHLLCDIHMRDNIVSKLCSLNIKGPEKQEFMNEIFGITINDTITPGLVDCQTAEDFDQKLDSLKDIWFQRHVEGKNFYQYFLDYKSDLIKNCMSASLRSQCGLGFPPRVYTQNANECINNVVKSDLNIKKKQRVPEFIHSIKRTVLRQETEVKLALINEGNFKLKEEYSHLQVKEDRYYKMDKKQKALVYNKYLETSLRPRQTTSSLLDTDNENQSMPPALSVSPEDSGITNIPFPVLNSIFRKASQLHHSKIDIVPLPGQASSSNILGKYLVTSATDANRPHHTIVFHSGQITCDKECSRWDGYKICSHSVAVAEHCGSLRSFIDWYRRSSKSVSLTGMVSTNLPASRGKKPQKSTQRRKGTANKQTPTLAYYNEQADENSGDLNKEKIRLPYPKPPDGGYILYFLEDCDSRVSKCYGCKGKLKENDKIPMPPRDLVVVTRARREFIKDGVKSLGDIGNVYFHFSESCIKQHNKYFVSSLLFVSGDVKGKFKPQHKELLKQCQVAL